MQTTQVLDGRYELGPLLGQGDGRSTAPTTGSCGGRSPSRSGCLRPRPSLRRAADAGPFRGEGSATRTSWPCSIPGSDDGIHYIVTELVEGETLAERIRRDGPLPADEAVAIGVDVARALAAARAGSDPPGREAGNVMLTPEGAVVWTSGSPTPPAPTRSPAPAWSSAAPRTCRRSRRAATAWTLVRTSRLRLRAVRDVDRAGAVPGRHAGRDDVSARERGPASAVLDPAGSAGAQARRDAVPREGPEEAIRLRGGSPEEALLAAPLGGMFTAPLVPVGGGDAPGRPGGGPDRRTPPIPFPRRAGRPWYRRVPARWLAVAGVVALLGLAAFALASTDDELRPRQAAREAGRSVSGAGARVHAAVGRGRVDGPHRRIASRAASGGIDEGVSDKLADKAVKILEAYGVGDDEGLARALGELGDELARASTKGKISTDAAAALSLAMLEL